MSDDVRLLLARAGYLRGIRKDKGNLTQLEMAQELGFKTAKPVKRVENGYRPSDLFVDAFKSFLEREYKDD